MRSLNAVFSFNVRLLWVFHLGVLMGPNYCSVHAKKQIRVRLSEGGGIQSDFLSKGVVFHGFKLFPRFIYFLFESFGWGRNKK